MLLAQHPGSQSCSRIALQDRHHRLRQNASLVQLGSDFMHGCPSHDAAHVNGALVGIQARKSREQRRVNVDQTPCVVLCKAWRQNPHETSQHHQRGVIAVNGQLQRSVEGFTGVVQLVINDLRGYAQRLGRGQSPGLRAVADNACHAGTQAFMPLPRTRSLHNGGHVGAVSRDQNNDVFFNFLHTPTVYDAALMTLKILTPIEARVLATLMEKARTVPDSYPLSLNALVLGCNQKTSREPLMDISNDEASQAVSSLKALSLVFEGSSSRVPRFEHNFQRAAGVTEAQAVLLGLLMLRGPQTPAELRGSGERWYKFADVAAIEAVLQDLQTRGDNGGQTTVLKLPRMPGAREQRWTHLLCGQPDVDAMLANAPALGESSDMLARLTAVENSVARLKADNTWLRAQLMFISEQLGFSLPKSPDLDN